MDGNLDKNKRGREEEEEDRKNSSELKVSKPDNSHNQPASNFNSSVQNPGTSGLNTYNTPDRGAVFAVWNLCDFGGGVQSTHWQNDTKNCRTTLPDQLEAIKADVLGLLEIKTGHLIVKSQIPEPPSLRTAFRIGAMTALMFFLARKEKSLLGIEKHMWVGENRVALEVGLECGIRYCSKNIAIYKSLIFEVEGDDLDTDDTTRINIFMKFADLVLSLPNEQQTEKNVKLIYNIIAEICAMPQKTVDFKISKDFDSSRTISNQKQDFEIVLGEVSSAFKKVQEAFIRAGKVIEIEKKEAEGENNLKEANGEDLIKPVLEKFIKNNPDYKRRITPKVNGNGETTVFVYNTKKFLFLEEGTMEIQGRSKDNSWKFRCAGYVLLQCLKGTLNEKKVMVVAWHAPSENHVGFRADAFPELLKQINSKVKDKDTNVVLLADMNIRKIPAKCEQQDKIIPKAYDRWVPESTVHMEECTSLKKTVKDGTHWNHPFDKVLLLKNDENDLKIEKYEKLNNLSVDQIRVYSDHSWLKAKISPK